MFSPGGLGVMNVSHVSFLTHKEAMRRSSATTDSGFLDEYVQKRVSEGGTELYEAWQLLLC